ncbi:hypothetical protein OPQ81_004676 [Rhizoctonia solani]|nr:hypothetical protein OPQ81_004676 [Rhizoctonia solani]
MYSTASQRPLEALAKTLVRPGNLAVCSRSFGSTSCIRSVAVLHKNSSTKTDPVVFTSETLERKTLTRPGHGPRVKYISSRLPNDRGPLREVHIATRVKELCHAGKLEEAADVCQNTPAALQGAPAWNTVIYHALSKGRYNYGYTLYQQMKKRHIIPTVATYTILMTSYAEAKPEILTPLQLERAQNIYKEWVNLALSARTEKAVATITSVHPTAAYISVLANAKLYQSIWDTFYDLDLEGPLAPNQYVFTSMFIAFAKRTTTTNDISTPNDTTLDDGTAGENVEASHTLSDIRMKNAQDARLLWRMVDRSLERRPFPVDSHLVVAALRALQHGGQPELDLALKIINKYLGLRAPDEPAPSEPTKPLELNVRLFDSALVICKTAKRPDLTSHFLDVLTLPEHPQRSIVNTGAMNHLLEAHASLALRACLAAQDWDAAKKLTKRLASTANSKRIIDSETIYLVLKIAHVLKPTNKRLHERQLRQALDAVYYVVSVWPKDSNAVQNLYAKSNPGRVERRLVFQNALGDLVKEILNEFDGLRSIPGFDDLIYRLDQLRTKIPDDIASRYQLDL